MTGICGALHGVINVSVVRAHSINGSYVCIMYALAVDNKDPTDMLYICGEI